MLIASLSFDVWPEKRGEFLSTITQVIPPIRWSTGCLGCRLVSDCENPNVFTLVCDWDNRACLDRYLASEEFQILEGARFLLRQGPTLSIDEVISRGRHPSPVRHVE